jgi:pimeloyl-ACP methyl ester carboxylesterase/DNA-binding CsgD family transcriptional regulator
VAGKALAVTLPETRYAKSGDVRIAYQVTGHGPLDLVFVPGFISNIEVHWDNPGFRHLLTRLSSFTRLITFDKRGTGLSDRVDTQNLPSLETRMDDVRAVMDAAGSGRAALLGASEGGPMSILFAATYPKRTRALILYGSYAHFHTWVMGREALEEFIRGIEGTWGTGVNAPRFAPDQSKDGHFPGWWGKYERHSATPNAGIALARMNAAIDVRSVLASIRVPTLILHRREDARIKFAGGKHLAEKIPGARFVAFPGRDHPIWTGDTDPIIDEIEEFLTGNRPLPAADRVLATVMVVRLVSPAQQAARMGDRKWSELLDRLRDAAIQAVARYHGHLGVMAAEEIIGRFDGPARAVRCALALRDAADAILLEVAAGVHTGEIEIQDHAFAGMTLHVAERICAKARGGEILVSGVLTDLVAGSGLHFSERDSETIDGLQAPLRLLAVRVEQHLQPHAAAPATPRLEELSAREREVLALVADGLSNAGIAKRLQLSDHTVKRHVANILLKLDLPTRAAAAALVGRASPPRGL